MIVRCECGHNAHLDHDNDASCCMIEGCKCRLSMTEAMRKQGWVFKHKKWPIVIKSGWVFKGSFK